MNGHSPAFRAAQLALMSWASAVAAGAMLVALAGCAALDSPGSGGPVVDAPAYRIGDRWIYQAADGFRAPVRWEETREVIAIGADGITVRITQLGPTVNNSRTEQWSSPGIVRACAVSMPCRKASMPSAGSNWS